MFPAKGRGRGRTEGAEDVKTIRRLLVACAMTSAPLAFGVVATPITASATECGPGTFLDTYSNQCLVAQPPPPQPAPPPAWNGDLTPYFSVGTCIPIPIPFAPSICAGI